MATPSYSGREARCGKRTGPISRALSVNNDLRWELFKSHAGHFEQPRVLSMCGGWGQELNIAMKHEASRFRLFDADMEVCVLKARARIQEASKAGRIARGAVYTAEQADCFDAGFCARVAECTGETAEGAYDVVLCNLGLHYSWDTEQRALQAVDNASRLLAEGGVFMGITVDGDTVESRRPTCPLPATWEARLEPWGWVCRMAFEAEWPAGPYGRRYLFNWRNPGAGPHGEDAVMFPGRTGEPEFAVDAAELTRIAERVGLLPRMRVKNALDFRPDGSKGLDRVGREIAETYSVFAFQKY